MHPAANLEAAGNIKVSAAAVAGIQTPIPQLSSPQPSHCIALASPNTHLKISILRQIYRIFK